MRAKSLTVDKLLENNRSFSARIERVGLKPVVVRNIPLKYLDKVKNVARSAHESCRDKKSGEHDFVDIRILNELFKSSKPLTKAPFVRCEQHGQKILYCNENEYFDGKRCVGFPSNEKEA